MANVFSASPDCGSCAGCGAPDSPVVVCVKGCNGAAIPGAGVVVTDDSDTVMLDATTGASGCSPSVSLGAGSYHVVITPPAGIAGWDLTEADFTIPGGLTSPITLKLSDGYTCGCRAPDRHDYLGAGNPKPILPTTLYFSSAIGSCTLTWFPRPGTSMFSTGIYYGSFTVSDFPASDSTRDPYGNPQCTHMRHTDAIVDVFFDPCGGVLPFDVGTCFSAGSPTGLFQYAGLVFGVRYICGCIACDAEVGGMAIYDQIPDPNLVAMTDPHSLAEYGYTHTSSITAVTRGITSGDYKDGLAVSYDPFLWTANHYAGTIGYGLNACVRETWLPAGTVVISE